MTDAADENFDKRPEIVGLFADQTHLDGAVNALLAAGFDRTDISLLSSHDSLDTIEGSESAWKDAVTALVGEYKVLGPLAVSGGIFLAGGPVAGAISALIGAAVSGLAAKEVMAEVLARPHAEHYTRALEAGSIILWVRVGAREQENAARDILATNGGKNIHINARR
ncbi:MAG: hypothetical protein CMM74_00965 [Rhodospirillaceae bacterium]|jgi:hypothetical protein|nr:hypothetical protein [Rhodospirillaceae bacterium]